MKKIAALMVTITAFTLANLSVPVFAEYPDKPVEFVVPWPPGEPEDILTRMIADEFQSMYGQPAAVVNKPGGGGGPFPGAIEVAKAPADGSTVGSFVIGVPVVGPQIGIPELNPDPFTPVGIFLTYPFVLVTSQSSPFDTVEQMAEHGKSNKIVLGHYGAQLIPTTVTFAMAKNMGFKYGAESAYDLLNCNTLASGDVDVMNTVLSSILPCMDDVKILAAFTDKRISVTPDVRTVTEIDPSLKTVLWTGLFVVNGTAQEVIDKIEAAAKIAMESDKAKDYARETGTLIYWQNSEESAARILSDIKEVARLHALVAD